MVEGRHPSSSLHLAFCSPHRTACYHLSLLQEQLGLPMDSSKVSLHLELASSLPFLLLSFLEHKALDVVAALSGHDLPCE